MWSLPEPSRTVYHTLSTSGRYKLLPQPRCVDRVTRPASGPALVPIQPAIPPDEPYRSDKNSRLDRQGEWRSLRPDYPYQMDFSLTLKIVDFILLINLLLMVNPMFESYKYSLQLQRISPIKGVIRRPGDTPRY